ncbi:hypothetical protein BSK56_33235 [Paenibacillus borealis]|uniref:Uncharacterized protein n=1 Tax=Paenibacillus borealis TaxID=160799 RepID=A0ABX3GRV4_PAEBO|nr:hypothetical protein [Paenibacillus borealis]OMD35144.1 hypothetical protein BSK56_33235 [Paenibacillus borealis]
MKNIKKTLLSSSLILSLVIPSSPSVFASESQENEIQNYQAEAPATPLAENDLSEEDLFHKQVFDQIQLEDEMAKELFTSQEDQLSLENEQLFNEPNELNSKAATQSLTKSFLRSQWNLGASILIAGGYYLSGTFLQHSLADSPSTLIYYHGSNQASSIQYSSEFQKALLLFRNSIPKTSATYYSQNTSFALNANRDQYLALHNVNATFAAQKLSSGAWSIIATVRDRYNFEYWNYSSANGLPGRFVTIVNNYAADNQRLGVVVPYDIYFYINTY